MRSFDKVSKKREEFKVRGHGKVRTGTQYKVISLSSSVICFLKKGGGLRVGQT